MYDEEADEWVVDLYADDVVDGLSDLNLEIIPDDLAIAVVRDLSGQPDCVAVNDSL